VNVLYNSSVILQFYIAYRHKGNYFAKFSLSAIIAYRSLNSSAQQSVNSIFTPRVEKYLLGIKTTLSARVASDQKYHIDNAIYWLKKINEVLGMQLMFNFLKMP
jgi:hypothetical protein